MTLRAMNGNRTKRCCQNDGRLYQDHQLLSLLSLNVTSEITGAMTQRGTSGLSTARASAFMYMYKEIFRHLPTNTFGSAYFSSHLACSMVSLRYLHKKYELQPGIDPPGLRVFF